MNASNRIDLLNWLKNNSNIYKTNSKLIKNSTYKVFFSCKFIQQLITLIN